MRITSKVSRILFILLLILVPLSFTQATTNHEGSANKLNIIINPTSAWSEDFNVTALGLISVRCIPANASYRYHLTIHNGTNYQIISRSNITGEIFFNFIWEGLFRAYIWNPGEEVLEIDLGLDSDRLTDTEDFGYTFDLDENRCIQTTVAAFTERILYIDKIERGNYKIKLSSFDDDSNLKFFLSDVNPLTETDWKDTAKVVSWSEFMEKDFQIGEGYNWIVLSSLDGAAHTVTVVMIYLGGEGLRTQDMIVAIVLVSALILLLVTQATNKKKRKSRKSYYSTKLSRQEVQKQLHLSSQVDIRYEGGRYVYVPPDLTNPELLDEGSADDENKEKSE